MASNEDALLVDEVMSVEDVKEVLDFVLALAVAIEKVWEDKKVGVTDIAHLMPVLMAVPKAIGNIAAVPGQLVKMSDEQRAALVAHAKSELNLDNDVVEVLVEQAIEIGLGIAGLIALMVSLRSVPANA